MAFGMPIYCRFVNRAFGPTRMCQLASKPRWSNRFNRWPELFPEVSFIHAKRAVGPIAVATGPSLRRLPLDCQRTDPTANFIADLTGSLLNVGP